MTEFSLHPQLAQDCAFIVDLELSRLLLMNSSDFPWCILVPRRADVTEIYELSEAEQICLLQESAQLCRAMQAVFFTGKMNVAALGNVVPQLHVHHVLRSPQDKAWPKPVWGFGPAVLYGEEVLARQIAALRQQLQ